MTMRTTTVELLLVSSMTGPRVVSLETLGCNVRVEDELYHIELPTGWRVESLPLRGLIYVVDDKDRPRAVLAPHPSGVTAGILGVLEHATDYVVSESSTASSRGGAVQFRVFNQTGDVGTTDVVAYEHGGYQEARRVALRQAWAFVIRYPWL